MFIQRSLLCVRAQDDDEAACIPGLLGSKFHTFNIFVLAEGKISWPGDLKEAGTLGRFFFETQNKKYVTDFESPARRQCQTGTEDERCFLYAPRSRQWASPCVSYRTVEKTLQLPAIFVPKLGTPHAVQRTAKLPVGEGAFLAAPPIRCWSLQNLLLFYLFAFGKHKD